MYCFREYQPTTRFIKQYEKSTSNKELKLKLIDPLALPLATKTIRSAYTHFNHVAIPSATMAITSAISKNMQPFHLPQVAITSVIRYLVMTSANVDVAIPSATLSYYLSIISGNTICHNGNNISHSYKVTAPSATVKTPAVTQNGILH